MDRKTSVRNYKPNEANGTDGRTFIKGDGAKKTPAQSATNTTEQYTVAAPPKDKLGGENTNS